MTAVTVISLKVSMRMLVKKHLVHVTVLGTRSAQLILIALMFAKHSTCKISWTPPRRCDGSVCSLFVSQKKERLGDPESLGNILTVTQLGSGRDGKPALLLPQAQFLPWQPCSSPGRARSIPRPRLHSPTLWDELPGKLLRFWCWCRPSGSWLCGGLGPRPLLACLKFTRREAPTTVMAGGTLSGTRLPAWNLQTVVCCICSGMGVGWGGVGV